MIPSPEHKDRTRGARIFGVVGCLFVGCGGDPTEIDHSSEADGARDPVEDAPEPEPQGLVVAEDRGVRILRVLDESVLVLRVLDGEGNQDKKVSNFGEFRAQAIITGAAHPSRISYLDNLDDIGADYSGAILHIRAISAVDQANVPIEGRMSGSDWDHGEKRYSHEAKLTIRADPSELRPYALEYHKKHLRFLEAEGSQSMRQAYDLDPDEVTELYGRMLTMNRPGRYSLTALYLVVDHGQVVDKIESNPIRLEIVDDGNPFNRHPAFKFVMDNY